MDTSEKIKMTIEMEVTIPQALALQAMFEYWNYLSVVGSSRIVGFYVDGDGNFHPEVRMKLDKKVPELTNQMRDAAWTEIKDVETIDRGDRLFDFDSVAWMLRGVEDPNE